MPLNWCGGLWLMWCGQGSGGDVRTREWLLEHRLLRELEEIEKMLEEIRADLAE